MVLARLTAAALVVALGACDGGSSRDAPKAFATHTVRPKGEWRSALEGTAVGVTWQLWVAPGTQGGRCASMETNPPLGGVSVQRGRDGSGTHGPASASPVHRGRRANCAPEPASTDREPLYLLDADRAPQQGPGPHYVAAVVASEATDVVAVFSDGSTEELHPMSGLVVLVWQGDRRLDFVDMRLADWAGPTRCGGSDGLPLLDDLGGAGCYSKET